MFYYRSDVAFKNQYLLFCSSNTEVFNIKNNNTSLHPMMPNCQSLHESQDSHKTIDLTYLCYFFPHGFRYNPYVQARGRIDQLKRLGHSVDKVVFK